MLMTTSISDFYAPKGHNKHDQLFLAFSRQVVRQRAEMPKRTRSKASASKGNWFCPLLFQGGVVPLYTNEI
ncbi:unnamed protein product [Ilex paraguariensis]|uniref:Uncharacterized protein n=1 Tax=Ilex paraguariensis TaxID=185542 RepID=A0ABC8RHJ9_9AQUA